MINYLVGGFLKIKVWIYWWITYYSIAYEDVTITIIREEGSKVKGNLFLKPFTIPKKWNRKWFKKFGISREIFEEPFYNFIDTNFGGNELTSFLSNARKESDKMIEKVSVKPWDDAAVNSQKFFITYFDEDNKNELVVISEHEGIFFSEKDLKDWKYFASEKAGFKQQYTKKMFKDWFELRK